MGGCSVRFGGDYVYLAGVLHGTGDLFYCHIAESQLCRVRGCLGVRQRAWHYSACAANLFVRLAWLC